jgi:hypothetical protein
MWKIKIINVSFLGNKKIKSRNFTCRHQDSVFVAALSLEAPHTFRREEQDDVLHQGLPIGVVVGRNLEGAEHVIQKLFVQVLRNELQKITSILLKTT